jgi:Xaa-Pro aminopeptidase
VDGKQAQVAELLRAVGVDALLLLEPENVAWMSSGGVGGGTLNPEDAPALYCTAEARWLVARNLDTQRLFDQEVDGLGFQLKEWPWSWGRSQLLQYLLGLRRAACDRPFGDALVVGDQLRQRRLALSPYEITRFRELGHTVSHALEATCRSLTVGQTEQEIAGQVAHRLIHRGAACVAVAVAADGRSRRYRQFGLTDAKLKRYAVLTTTGSRDGLYATASRTVAFGSPDEALQKEHDAACKVSATYIAGSVPDGAVAELLTAGRRIYKITGFEHDWRLCLPGHVTGHAAVERAWLAQTADLLRPGWAVTWQASAGAACSSDTYLVSAEGPKFMTATAQNWPQKRIRIQGGSLSRPDILQR